MLSYLLQLKQAPILIKLFIFLLALIPFHAVIVTVFYFDNPIIDLAIRSWKEIFIVCLFVFSIPLMYKQKIWQDSLTVVIGMFALLHLVYGLIFWDGVSTLFGIRNNLAFLLIYIIGITYSQEYSKNESLIIKTILALGFVVATSALLQLFLPQSWFEFNLLGVGGDVSAIQDSNIIRFHGIMSGPLQLGSYLILPTVLSLKYYKTHRFSVIFYALFLLTAIFLTYSRAAMLAGVGSIILVWLITQKRLSNLNVLRLGLATLAILIGVFLLALQWRPLSLLVFHAEPDKALTESSTADHIEYSYEAAQDLVQDPLGDGPGAAGPASAYADQVVLTENFFLQIGLEVGVLGALAFLYISFYVGLRLWEKRQIEFFVGFLALSGMNLLLHTWTDTATAWTFWLVAGLASGLAYRHKPLRSVARIFPKKIA